MSPSLEYLERCAAETGFRVETLEKVARLGELAADVGRQRSVAFRQRRLHLLPARPRVGEAVEQYARIRHRARS